MKLPRLMFHPRERVDLHLHSHYSDGTHSPSELAAIAAEHRLSVIALTDHAEVSGIAEMTAAAAAVGIYVIPGVELNSNEGDFLGYFVDYQDEQFLDFLAAVRRMRAHRIERILRRLQGLGYPIDSGVLQRRARPGVPSRTTIARLLVDQGRLPDVDAAFERLLGRAGLAYEPAVGPDAETCVRAIQAAGGIAVEAHPRFHHSGEDPAQLDRFYARMARLGLIGVEAGPPHHLAVGAAADRVRQCAEGHGLIAVGGSNFHGKAVGAVAMGSETIGGDTLQKLSGHLPGRCLHRSLIKRLQWRAENLTPEEFRGSLAPEVVRMPNLWLTQFVDRGPPPQASNLRGEHPFVVIGPGALGRLETVLHSLRGSGAKTLGVQPIRNYPELAWDLYELQSGTMEERQGNLLRFNLDHHLYGERAHAGKVAFFEPPEEADLRLLKKKIRRELGPIRFYRVQHQRLVEECLTTFVHLPDVDRIGPECQILAAHGIVSPAL
jgi:predicted metal-dependent phosphoesterase TrpH